MENKEAAGRLEVLGEKIWNASRDELYLGMRFLDVALSSLALIPDGQLCASDGYQSQPIRNRWRRAVFSSSAAWRIIPAEPDPGEPWISAYGISLHLPAYVEGISGRTGG